MSAIPLLAAPLVQRLRDNIGQRAAILRQKGCQPQLAIVDATGDAASATYAKMKLRQADKLGISASLYGIAPYSPDTRDSFLELLENLGHDPKVHGIFIERPMPEELELSDWLKLLPPHKDIEGIHPVNLGKLFLDSPTLPSVFVPTTALACLEMLKFYKVPLAGAHAVVVGRSITVGRPLAWMLLQANATVTICHSRTDGLAKHTREADILISATGCRNLISADHVKSSSVVIDVGTSYNEDGSVCGDVQYESVAAKAHMITPHIGGLGPVTTALLLHNAVRAAEMAFAGVSL
ncbi:MAG: bifunctional 5,10-methylenetetrahydrofolate dehydrogenase/5,10-methenyltetrahydrofolate cyclohydrolase [bacterium]|nr:bifunctional 5,10-methylenetetrahydrofolate dehydrogenase/5,10-methenyltetrahydrofolate cyclohydrolase [bacterium]